MGIKETMEKVFSDYGLVENVDVKKVVGSGVKRILAELIGKGLIEDNSDIKKEIVGDKYKKLIKRIYNIIKGSNKNNHAELWEDVNREMFKLRSHINKSKLEEELKIYYIQEYKKVFDKKRKDNFNKDVIGNNFKKVSKRLISDMEDI